MIGLYDLSKMPTTYDFAAWLVIARTHGCNNVHFVTDRPMPTAKYSAAISWARFGNLIIPMVELSGMTFSTGGLVPGNEYRYIAGDVEKTYLKCGRLEKLKPVSKVERTGYVTITLRDSFRNKYRNSNAQAWDAFAEYLKARGTEVVIVPECEDAPIPLRTRMALYAGAEMNLGASGGPMWLCHMSDAPCIIMNVAPKRPHGEPGYDLADLMASSGFPFGSQFSFRTPKQALVWKPDTLNNIVDAYDSMLESA